MNSTNEEKERIIRQAFELGFKYEKTLRGCCQCTIAAIQDALQIEGHAVFQAGSGLTAGGGVSCEGSCGGYVGGVMVMSSLFGRRRENCDDDFAEKECAHNMAFALLQRFEREYGSVICKAIHTGIFGRSFDLKNSRDRQAFEELGAHADKCTSVVGKAASWAAELILEELSSRSLSLRDVQTGKTNRVGR